MDANVLIVIFPEISNMTGVRIVKNVHYAEKPEMIHMYGMDAFALNVKIDPKSKDAIYFRGFSRQNTGDQKGAIEDYNLVIKLDPYDHAAYYGRAISKATSNDSSGALADAAIAEKLGVRDAVLTIKTYLTYR